MSKKKLISLEERFTGILWAIVAPVKEYQLCWNINKVLGFDLKRADDVELINKKRNRTSVFSFFKSASDIDKWQVFMMSNKHLGEFLIPEVKQADYFLIIRGEVSDSRESELFAKLKGIQVIQLIVKLNFDQLKSKANLMVE